LSTRRAPPEVKPRIRILCGEEIAFGPGKADLLSAIADTGTIAGAARGLGMSYMRAWSLVQTMNQCFRTPLVDASRGGESGGGAVLTATGEEVLVLYRRMEAASRSGLEPEWLRFRQFLRASNK
jgi:molybdate transport system regulatory protein